MESKKNDTNELIYKTEIDSQKTTYGYQKGKGRDKLGIWTEISKKIDRKSVV